MGCSKLAFLKTFSRISVVGMDNIFQPYLKRIVSL